VNVSKIAAPAWRSFLASRAGTGVQIALVALGAVTLPGGLLLSPVLLALLAGALIRLNGDGWRSVGFGPPNGTPLRRAFWWISTGLLVGLLWQYASVGFLVPLFSRVLGASAPAGAAPQPGLLPYLLSLFVYGLVHPLAKGLAYRGFLLNRLERAFGSSTAGVAASFVIASVVFGLGNWYQGPAGVIATALTGAVFNALYYWAHRNVWPSVLAHAVYNSVALTLLYLGHV
jgi:uncharacterized protein